LLLYLTFFFFKKKKNKNFGYIKLTGSIPAAIGKLTKLTYLYVKIFYYNFISLNFKFWYIYTYNIYNI